MVMPGPGAGLSVVIPHWGDPALALGLIDDLTSREGSRAIELIVVDDCSPTRFPLTPRATVVRRTTNGGFGAAVNDGAARAREPWLLIANSDLRVAPDFIESMIQAAEPLQPAICSPELVEGGVRRPAANLFRAAGYRSVWWRLKWLRVVPGSLLSRRLGHDSRVRRGDTRQTEWLTGACLLLPTAVFVGAGGFDERFHMFAEDADLQRRLRAVGVRAWSVGTVSVEHAAGASTGADRYEAYLRADFTYARIWREFRRLWTSYVACALIDFTYDLAADLAGREVGAWRWLRLRLAAIGRARRVSKIDVQRPAKRNR